MKKIFSIIIITTVFLACNVTGTAGNSDSDSVIDITDNSETTNTSIFNIKTSTSQDRYRSTGINNEDLEDSLTFRSSDISFWYFQTLDDIENLYSVTQAQYISDLGEEAQLASRVNMGDQYWSFTTNESNIYPATENMETIPEIINLIRIDIGFGEFDIEDDGVKITDLYDEQGNSYQYNWEGTDFTGINGNSIMLVDDSFLTKSIYIPRGVASVPDDEETLTSTEIETINKLLERSGIIDLDGALFVPLESLDLSSYDSISKITLDFTWNIDQAITFVDGKYVMENRTGNGLCFDFNVSLTVEEE